MAEFDLDIEAATMVRELTDLLHDQTHLSRRMDQLVISFKDEFSKVFEDNLEKVGTIRRCMKNVMLELAQLIASSTKSHDVHPMLNPE